MAEAPGKLKNRDDRKVLATEKEKTVLTPQTKSYNEFGQECVSVGCTVDMFLFNNAYVDVATLSQVSTVWNFWKFTLRFIFCENSVKLIFFFLHWYPWTRKKSVGGRHEAFGKVIFKCRHFRAVMSAFFSQKCVVVRIIVVSAFDLPVLCSLLLHTIDAIILVWVQRYCHVLEYNSSLEDLCQSIAKCWNNKVLF